MARTSEPKFHIAMFPWFATGHMTPFLHLSNELAQRGHKISFLIPKKAQLQLQNMNHHPSLITFHTIAVPHVDGLPLGTETASEISVSLTTHLATALDLTRDQVESMILDLKPEFVFYDFAHWVPELSRRLGFKAVMYLVVCAASAAIALVPARVVPTDRMLTEAEMAVPPEGYPSSTMVLHGDEARALLFISREYGSGLTFYERITSAFNRSDAIAMRTCKEIEGRMCEYIGTQYDKTVLFTGPVLREPEKTRLDDQWDEWLKRFEPRSVVYCALGSQLVLEKNQFQELVLGLELTGLPFFAALKPPDGATSIHDALPNGFETRIKDRGIVFGSWVNQTLMLDHPSIGCFVSHCGYGSMWESLMSDNQIVLVPHLGDQILNARLLSEELKVAVEVKKAENGSISKESLCNAVKCVMDEASEVAALIKMNHAKWKETLTRPGFMSDYIDNFVQNLSEL